MIMSLTSRFRWYSLFVATVAVIAPAIASAADTTPPLEYSIEDQFGATHTEDECRGKVAVYLGGDRKGSTMIPDWGPRLHRELARELDDGSVCSVGFAHLKGAPFFVKKKIVDGFPKDPDAWTLLDWKGHFLRTWGGEKGAANYYVFDRRGSLVMQRSLREFDQTLFDEIIDAVRAALES